MHTWSFVGDKIYSSYIKIIDNHEAFVWLRDESVLICKHKSESDQEIVMLSLFAKLSAYIWKDTLAINVKAKTIPLSEVTRLLFLTKKVLSAHTGQQLDS